MLALIILGLLCRAPLSLDQQYVDQVGPLFAIPFLLSVYLIYLA